MTSGSDVALRESGSIPRSHVRIFRAHCYAALNVCICVRAHVQSVGDVLAEMAPLSLLPNSSDNEITIRVIDVDSGFEYRLSFDGVARGHIACNDSTDWCSCSARVQFLEDEDAATAAVDRSGTPSCRTCARCCQLIFLCFCCYCAAELSGGATASDSEFFVLPKRLVEVRRRARCSCFNITQHDVR